MSSTVFTQDGDRRQIPSLFFDQCLHKLSLLYRPEIILDWIVAIAMDAGEDPQVVQSGWGAERGGSKSGRNSEDHQLLHGGVAPSNQ